MERKNYKVLAPLDEVDGERDAFLVDNPTVTVYLSGTTTLAAIYDDDGLTAKANPFTGPLGGLVHFYAADGKYDVKFTGGAPSLGSVGYTLGAELFDDTLSLSDSGSGIEQINSLTAASQTLVTGTSGSDFAITSSSSTHTFNLPFATASAHGKLSLGDWTIFNAKIGSLNGLTSQTQALAIGSTGASPNWASASSTHTLNLPIASASVTGILSSSDWALFNSKGASLSGGTTADYLRGGDLTFQPLTTSAVPEGSRLYFTDARVRAALSGNSPITFNSGTGAIGIDQSSGVQAGYLSATDWTTFNNKISSVTTDATGTDFSASTAAGVVTVHLPAASPTVTGGKITNAAQSLSGAKTHYSTFITAAGRRRYARYHTAPASVTVSGGLDDAIVINKGTAGATAVTLPSSPTAGDTYTIKDGKGDAASNNITVSPAAGTIDGAATNVINSNYGSRDYMYNGVEWNVI